MDAVVQIVNNHLESLGVGVVLQIGVRLVVVDYIYLVRKRTCRYNIPRVVFGRHDINANIEVTLLEMVADVQFEILLEFIETCPKSLLRNLLRNELYSL